MKHGKVTHLRNYGEKLGKDHLILLIIGLLFSQVAYVKLLKEWSTNVLCGIGKRIVYWLKNSVVIGQIDELLIIYCA